MTTVYAVRYPARSTRARVVYFPKPEHLDVWCRRNGVDEGVVGGFFLRDPKGFSAGAGQFDSDITEGRYPRAALGVSEEWLVAVACDGRRSNVDGGLSMRELAEIMVELGVDSAINLDGGGSTTLVHRGHLLNRPYSSQDQPAPASRRVVTALTFLQRS